MKKLLCLMIVVLSAFAVKAQDATQVVNALKSGNADQVSNFFDKTIDIKFPEKEEIKGIGKNQAGIAFKSFYDENKIKGFDLSSQRELGGTMYIAGKLLNNGDGFNLTMMLKNKEGRPQIVTIRIN